MRTAPQLADSNRAAVHVGRDRYTTHTVSSAFRDTQYCSELTGVSALVP